MEELLRIRRELAGLRAAAAEARWRAFRGLDFELAAAYRRHPAAVHDEAPRILDEALRRSGDEAEREALVRLRGAVTLERVRAGAVRLEEGLLRQELVQVAEGPEGPLPLRAALRAVALEPQRARRSLLADACARAAEDEQGRRSDRVALLQEACGREGADLAALAGVDAAALRDEARAALALTEDAYRELLPWALGRWVQEGLQPLPRGELADHDLAWLRTAAYAGALYPAGGLRLAATSVVEAMDFDARRGNLRLDLERRPLARVGASVAPLDVPARVAVSLSPLGTPADWRELFGAIARGLRLVSIARAAPVEDRWAGDEAVGFAFSALFGRIVHAPAFLRRLLHAPRAAAEEAARALALLDLLDLREACGRALAEAEIWARPPSRAVARTFGELLAEATHARFDERRFLEDADPALPAATTLRGLAIAGEIEPALRERCDEDWWRNPRTGPLLQGAWARGGAVRGDEAAKLLGGGAPSLAGYARALVAQLG